MLSQGKHKGTNFLLNAYYDGLNIGLHHLYVLLY